MSLRDPEWGDSTQYMLRMLSNYHAIFPAELPAHLRFPWKAQPTDRLIDPFIILTILKLQLILEIVAL